MTRPLSLALILTLSSCGFSGVDEENYADTYAPEYCHKVHKCNLGLFESEWSDMGDCIDSVADDVQDVNDAQDDRGCHFDDSNAEECLTTFRDADCEDFHEGDAWDDCDNVWEDCN